MAKTPITAAAQWTGSAFDTGADIPHWIIQAMGAAKLTFDTETGAMGVETVGGPVSAASGDWLMLLPADGGLAVATNDDFNANYEIAA